jgi:2-C-methyl-D-erythritol 2,4-cyclodiphosphate synthase
MRIGFGYDIHRVVEGGTMFLGGVEVSRQKSFLSHSDGDVLLHAIADAVLGALSAGDIGKIFPDTDLGIKGISSVDILKKVSEIMRSEGFKLGNLDCVVVAQEPKISEYSDRMAGTISSLLFSEPHRVSVKGKTKEGLGEVGQKLAMEAYAVVMLEKES